MVLWDERDKRGWLVNGTGALLHLLRTSLAYENESEFKSVFLFQWESWKEASITHSSNSALQVLLDQSNMKLRIFPEKPEAWDEEDGQQRFYCVGDRFEQLYDILEKMIEHEADINGKEGININPNPQTRLEGWDFSDIARCRGPFYPRVEFFPTLSDGWTNLVREINATTLFGRGFGELIQPAGTGRPCSFWMDLPKSKYYLAGCTSDIKKLADDFGGNTGSNPVKLTPKIEWQIRDCSLDKCRCLSSTANQKDMESPASVSGHPPSLISRSLLSLLRKRGPKSSSHSEYAQILIYHRLKIRKLKSGLNPKIVDLDDRGALIFSHNEMRFRKSPTDHEITVSDSRHGSSRSESQAVQTETIKTPSSSHPSVTAVTGSEDATIQTPFSHTELLLSPQVLSFEAGESSGRKSPGSTSQTGGDRQSITVLPPSPVSVVTRRLPESLPSDSSEVHDGTDLDEAPRQEIEAEDADLQGASSKEPYLYDQRTPPMSWYGGAEDAHSRQASVQAHEQSKLRPSLPHNAHPESTSQDRSLNRDDGQVIPSNLGGVSSTINPNQDRPRRSRFSRVLKKFQKPPLRDTRK